MILHPFPQPAIIIPRPPEIVRPGDPRFRVPPMLAMSAPAAAMLLGTPEVLGSGGKRNMAIKK